MSGGYQIGVPHLSPTVKKLIVINVAVWILAVVILQGMVLGPGKIFNWLGLVPLSAVMDFHVWQFFTYMFVHSSSVFHLLFNMLFLWFMGAELEQLWGRRFFLTYYLVCGIGAGILYTLMVYFYYFFSREVSPLIVPVVGASGAVFGILLAYGLYFGDRIVYFFGVFPMKARYFVMILGGFEFLMLLSEGFGSKVANLAHVGGLVVGYLFLRIYPRVRDTWLRRRTKSQGRKLKLVVDNEIPPKGPRYWN